MQNSEMDYPAEYRPSNPIAMMVTFFLALLAFIIILISMIANWQTFLSASPIIVKVVIVCVIVGVPGAIILLAGMKIIQWHDARTESKAEARRVQEKHELYVELSRTRLHADERGNRDAVIMGGQIITVSSGNFAQPVPQTYSPHITHAPAVKVTEEKNEPAQIASPAIEAPTMQYILSQLEENALQVCLGVSATTGNPFVIDLIDGVHYKFIGTSGMGKSCMAAAILHQALKMNDANTLQIALLDLEHKTSRLFENAPHIAELQVGRRSIPMVATDANEVASHLGYLRKELDRRKALSESELNRQRFMLIYVEEFLSLQLEVDDDLKTQMLADFSILAVRARKYGMYFLACAQDDYANEELRSAKNQFQVRGAFSVPPTAATSAGFYAKELIKKNFAAKQPGQFVLETRGCNDIMLAPQYDLKKKLAALSARQNGGIQTMERERSAPFVSSFNTDTLNGLNGNGTGAERVVNGSLERAERPIQADGTHIAEVKYYKSLNWGKQAIIEQVWNAKKGGSAAYKSAEAEYEAIIAQLESET